MNTLLMVSLFETLVHSASLGSISVALMSCMGGLVGPT
jgi:hypothetical protein